MCLRNILLRIVFIATLAVGFSSPAHADYPVAQITNNSPYTVRGTVEYASAFCSNDNYSVAPGRTWRARNRGVCLITGITGSIPNGTQSRYGERTLVTKYTSSGTAYAQFRIEAFGDRYRIFSQNEYEKNQRTDSRQSPGFRFVNKTQWPVAFSLDQVGCLYHDVIPASFPGRGDGVLVRDTGAVWFTLRMHIQPDGVNPLTDLDCAEPIIEIVGDVALAAMTGGASAAASSGARIAARQVAKQAIKKAARRSVKELAKNGREQIGRYLKETGSISMGGQYAGYDWPFRCDQMPEYHITGGPVVVRDEDGEYYLQPGQPFTVTKVNTCGNDMMRASPRRASARTDIPGGFFARSTDPEDANPGAAGDGNRTGSGGNAGSSGPSGPATGFANGPITSESVNGGNVVRADFGGGSYRQNSARGWTEYGRNGSASFNFTETGRDEWSVYLVDGSRNVQLQIDLFRKKVRYGQVGGSLSDLYDVTNSFRVGQPASTQGRNPGGGNGAINGRNVSQVFHEGGSFRQIGPGRWSEFNASGQATFGFEERGRDEWSVYLVDPSRNVQIQLDLFRKWISYGANGAPRSDLYRISRSQ